MGLLGDVYSYGDTLKRKVGGLLSDPRGTLEQFVGQLGDDMNTNISNMKTGYGFGGNKSVLSDPAQVQAAQRALADYGAQSGMAAATVWHGSPHKFDKFDSSKIGTGEGAQAYGHGLYLADNPTVAKNYQAKVSAMQGSGEPTIAGRAINWDSPQEAAAFEISRHNGDRAAAADFYARTFNNKKTEDLIRSGNDLPSVDLPGNLYKVDLPDEHIAKMLDWDKPLSQQPHVLKALGRLGIPASPTLTGEELIRGSLLKGLSNYDGIVIRGEEALRSKGIPGIRYLDGGSRGAGQGSSNFVVFPGNEGLLSILERNNKALDIFKDTAWEPPLFPDTTR